MSESGRELETAKSADQIADKRNSNLPLILVFVIAGIILLGTFVYAFMMTIPGSMPGMNH